MVGGAVERCHRGQMSQDAVVLAVALGEDGHCVIADRLNLAFSH